MKSAEPITNSKVLRTSYYKEYLEETQKSLKAFKHVRSASTKELSERMVWLPPQTTDLKTVIFDLDETLVHCCTLTEPAQHTLKLTDGSNREIRLNVRPFVKEVLAEVKKYFEVIVFTASERCYADTVLDFIDPGRSLIDWRLYREHCVKISGNFFKDLRVVGNRDLRKLIVVDNLAASFWFQLNNGVPIRSWFCDADDVELLSLLSYLRRLIPVDDVRLSNQVAFQLDSSSNN